MRFPERVLWLSGVTVFFLVAALIAAAAPVPFIVEQKYPAGGQPVSLTTGDFNKDGKIDVANLNSGGSVSVLLGNGDGSFQLPLTFSAGVHGIFITKGDMNGDGSLDLITSDGNGSYTLNILLGNGDGTFKAPLQYAVDREHSCVGG